MRWHIWSNWVCSSVTLTLQARMTLLERIVQHRSHLSRKTHWGTRDNPASMQIFSYKVGLSLVCTRPKWIWIILLCFRSCFNLVSPGRSWKQSKQTSTHQSLALFILPGWGAIQQCQHHHHCHQQNSSKAKTHTAQSIHSQWPALPGILPDSGKGPYKSFLYSQYHKRQLEQFDYSTAHCNCRSLSPMQSPGKTHPSLPYSR